MTADDILSFVVFVVFVVFLFRKMAEGEENCYRVWKDQGKTKGLFCVCTSSLKFIGQTMCTTKGVFAESVHCE